MFAPPQKRRESMCRFPALILMVAGLQAGQHFKAYLPESFLIDQSKPDADL